MEATEPRLSDEQLARVLDPAAITGHPTVRHSVDAMLQEERARWAMQIHDGLTQSVTSAVLELQTLRHRIKTDPQGAVDALKEVEEEIRPGAIWRRPPNLEDVYLKRTGTRLQAGTDA